MGGVVPRTESVVLGGLPFTSADYCDFRTHGPHMKIDDLSAPSARFVARGSASVTTVDHCPGRGRTLPAADNDSLPSSPYPPRSARPSQKPLLPRRPSPSRLLQRSPTQGTDAVETTGPTASAPASSGSPMPPTVKPSWDIFTRTRRRTATVASAASLLSTMALGPAGHLDHLPGGLTPRRESPGRGRVHPPPRPLLLPPRRSRRCQYRPTATAQSCGNSSLTAYAPSWRHTACTCQIGCPWRRC